ncbi:unnamed protein product [Ilex paraguariensis]|uniref:Uncharacterized protein n=1 Tax=Ilex paraguariensis TaxID=185542 RepID=A0ABC8SGE7_9AQUA
MGLSELERANVRHGDSHTSTAARWNPGNAGLETQYFVQPSMTRHLLNIQVEIVEPAKCGLMVSPPGIADQLELCFVFVFLQTPNPLSLAAMGWAG